MNAPIDVSTIRIETPRLILRPCRETDLADFYAYASVPGVGEMAGWSHHKSIDETRKILEMFLREKKTLAMELKECGKVIGTLGLEPVGHDPWETIRRGREVGYAMSKDYWGQGLMPEAVQAVIAYCFEILNIDYLTCGHFDRNHRSCRVIEKCGFHFLKNDLTRTDWGAEEPGKLYVLYNPHKEINHV